jgi:hypothetical protein
MPNSLWLAFSKPPRDVSDQEFNSWYDLHVRENMVSPGFVGAQRFAITPHRDAPVRYTHLALYEYSGDWRTWRTHRDTRIETGEIVRPEWSERVQWGSWECVPLVDRIVPDRDDLDDRQIT